MFKLKAAKTNNHPNKLEFFSSPNKWNSQKMHFYDSDKNFHFLFWTHMGKHLLFAFSDFFVPILKIENQFQVKTGN